MERTFGPATWFKVLCWVLAALCILLVFTLPFALVMIWLALKAKVVVGEQGLVVQWIGKRTIAWNEFAELRWGRAAGAVGAAMRPLTYRLDGKKGWSNIAVGAYEGTDEIVAAIRERTGLEIAAA